VIGMVLILQRFLRLVSVILEPYLYLQNTRNITVHYVHHTATYTYRVHDGTEKLHKF